MLSDKIANDFKREKTDQQYQQALQEDDILCVQTTELQVYELLRKTAQNKSSGSDGVHPKIYKFLADVWASPLTVIINNSLKMVLS